MLAQALVFEDATRLLNEEAAAASSTAGVLLDAYLPAKSSTLNLEEYLGLTAAEMALSLGFTRVGMLTVVQQPDIAGSWSRLGAQYPAAQLKYFDKTKLVTPNYVQEIADFFLSR